MAERTPAQQQAVTATGSILLEAGAGAGKTRTLVDRVLAGLLSREPTASIDRMLIVTFTDAAAREMRRRIARSLIEQLSLAPGDTWLEEQLALLDAAPISTLHSCCLQLIRNHFHELDIDPQSAVMDEAEARLFNRQTMDELLTELFDREDETAAGIRKLIEVHGHGEEQPIVQLTFEIDRLLQTLPDPERWLSDEQRKWSEPDSAPLQISLNSHIGLWAGEWRQRLQAFEDDCGALNRCRVQLESMDENGDPLSLAAGLETIAELGGSTYWKHGERGRYFEPNKSLFQEAATLRSHLPGDGSADPIADDLQQSRPLMLSLLELVRQYRAALSAAKRRQALLSFSDIEQFALRLLFNPESQSPTPLAQSLQDRFDRVFVDEYQDINEAQDCILRCLSRSGERANRFLVGDVKQSIYGFRLARPRIFLGYASDWRQGPPHHRAIPLSENFRTHEGLLHFINRTFERLMKPVLGGLDYDELARLKFGASEERAHFRIDSTAPPRTELRFFLKSRNLPEVGQSDDAGSQLNDEDWNDLQREAHLIAMRLSELRNDELPVWDESTGAFRPVDWRDMTILIRSPRNAVSVFSQVFAAAGIPFHASRGGFFEQPEVYDLVNLLTVLDNPVQDIPLIGVLRSPLFGFTDEDLALIRLFRRNAAFWDVLNLCADKKPIPNNTAEVTGERLDRLSKAASQAVERIRHWRDLSRLGSLSQCLESVLDDTGYEILLGGLPDGAGRLANLRLLFELTRRYDRQTSRGLGHFMEQLQSLSELDSGPEPVGAGDENCVRLMSIHQSKGLEFPVVVAAGLSRRFQFDKPVAGVRVDEQLGLCPDLFSENTGSPYPGAASLLADHRSRRDQLAEELRLLYVAMTRARDRLILSAVVSESRCLKLWNQIRPPDEIEWNLSKAGNAMDWLGMLIPEYCGTDGWPDSNQGESALCSWAFLQSLETVPAEPSPAETDSPAPVPDLDLEAQLERVRFEYPWLAETHSPAKISVTRLRKGLLPEEEAAEWSARDVRSTSRGMSRIQATSKGLSRREQGIACHRFLQHLDLAQARSADTLKLELDRLHREGLFTESEAAAVEVETVALFWNSDIGRRIANHPDRLRREMPFTIRLSGEEARRAGADTGISSDDFFLVQGIVDVAVILDGEVWILDYKTDDISAEDSRFPNPEYVNQMRLYRMALEKCLRRPVTHCWIHYLAAGHTVEMDT